MYKEHFLPSALVIAAAPRCFWYRLRYPQLVSFGLLANLARIAKLQPFRQIDAIIDVGANAGQFAFMAHTVWPASPIYSFEPDPQVYRDLQRTFQQHAIPGSAQALALGAERREAVLHVQKDSVNSSLLPRIDSQEQAAISISCVPLDEAMPTEAMRHSRFLLKIDTQGTEVDVLRGCPHLLRRCAGVLVEVAVDSRYEGGASLVEVLAVLQEAGFVLFDIVDLLRLPPARGRGLYEMDLLFVPRDGDR